MKTTILSIVFCFVLTNLCAQQFTNDDYIDYATYKIMFPNAFAPYLDGSNGGSYQQGEGEHTNRIFHPTYSDIDEFRMQIYNKNGILVFETDDINFGWDGYYAERLCPQDGYIYMASGHYSNGAAFNETGQFILIHK